MNISSKHRGESIRSLFLRKERSPSNVNDGLEYDSNRNTSAMQGSGDTTPIGNSIREEDSEGHEKGTPYLVSQAEKKLNQELKRGLTESSNQESESYSLESSYDYEVAALHTELKEPKSTNPPVRTSSDKFSSDKLIEFDNASKEMTLTSKINQLKACK